ncbi:hypothetical protein B7494_g1191 [Chlorociboria aeruginascens]|nr:hypothetical protein B7494_g1191 [Chlorociboria aeruginascens]
MGEERTLSSSSLRLYLVNVTRRPSPKDSARDYRASTTSEATASGYRPLDDHPGEHLVIAQRMVRDMAHTISLEAAAALVAPISTAQANLRLWSAERHRGASPIEEIHQKDLGEASKRSRDLRSIMGVNFRGDDASQWE